MKIIYTGGMWNSLEFHNPFMSGYISIHYTEQINLLKPHNKTNSKNYTYA